MDAQKKDELLKRKRENYYSRASRTSYQKKTQMTATIESGEHVTHIISEYIKHLNKFQRLIIFAYDNLPGQHHNQKAIEINDDEFDRELFEPTHHVEDGDDADIHSGHGFQNETLHDDDGIIQLHAQGTMTSYIRYVRNPASLSTSLHKLYI
jgi:hypothetical protein